MLFSKLIAEIDEFDKVFFDEKGLLTFFEESSLSLHKSLVEIAGFITSKEQHQRCRNSILSNAKFLNKTNASCIILGLDKIVNAINNSDLTKPVEILKDSHFMKELRSNFVHRYLIF